MNRFGFPVLCCFCLFFSVKNAAAEKAPNIQQRQQAIAETARFYLESSSGYVPGDLITESQIDELQQYLRRSFGNSPATHRGLLNRALKDDAPLSRYFYQEHGSQIIRSAAKKLGGYVEIEAMSLDRQGRQVLQNAMATGSEAEIIAKVEATRQKQSLEVSGNPQKRAPHQLKAIFTLEDFLEAAFSKTSEKNST